MKNVSVPTLFLVRLVSLVACIAFAAHADDYADVSQLARSGKLPEAMAKVDLYLSSQPKDPQMRFLKGVLQRDAGKTSDAVATFTRLTEDYPELPEPYNNLAVLYASQSQFDKARAALEMAIRTNPSYSTAHENLGDVYAKLASQAYNKALQLDNSNAAVAPKLAIIRELFSPSVSRTLRPSATSAVAAPQSTTAAVIEKAPLSLPSFPNVKQVAPAPTQPPPVQPKSPPAVVPPVQVAPAAPATATAPVQTPPSLAKVPAATASAAASAATSPTTASAGNSDKEVTALVKAWAAAWAAKDVKAYLGFYGKSFDPPGSMSRLAWEEERRQRISGKATISVKLENLVVTSTGTKATAKFRQDYKSGGLAVTSRKTLELQKTGEHWHIVKESVSN